jgi:transcriptional regulator with XRE-family HTH domain
VVGSLAIMARSESFSAELPPRTESMKPGPRITAKSTDPTVRRQELGDELRQLRVRSGLRLREVAEIVCVDESYVSRIENGFRVPSPLDLASLLTAYRADRATRQRLTALAAEAGESGWWQRDRHEPTERQRTLVSLEAKADSIVSFELALIPGLLQTSEYTRALLAESGLRSEDEVEAGMAARFCRQTVLEQRNPPTLLALVDELALHRVIGGPVTMRRQLDHLVQCSRNTRITVRVVPNGSSHAGLDGSFELIEQTGRPPVVFIEEASSVLFVEQRNEVDVYYQIVTRLSDIALDEMESVGHIAELAKRFGMEESAG